MRIKVLSGGRKGIELPLSDAGLNFQMRRIDIEETVPMCRLVEVSEQDNPLHHFEGQTVNMDEVNFFAKRMESLTEYERKVLSAYAEDYGVATMQDLINLTFSMKGLSLLTDFSDVRQVGVRLYMDEFLGMSEEEKEQTNFIEFAEKTLKESRVEVLPYGVFVEHGFEMQEVYNGKTFPAFVASEETVAVVEVQNKTGDTEYLYLPTDICSMNKVKERLQVQDYWEMEVTGIENLRLPDILVPIPEDLKEIERMTLFNEMCHAVKRFDEVKMNQLAMVVEFTGLCDFPDVAYIATHLGEFESPEHAINVIRRMLHVSGMVLDNASPAVLGHLSKNIRIAVLKTPLVDEDVGIAASIRIVNPQSLKKSDFVDGGTATDEMLDFLAECLRYGISICVAGATSSGKTTLAGWLLTTIPDNKRIFTIENGSRELALVREKDGKVTNSVIHTLTRFSENEKQNIDQDMLLDMALRFNPEIICVGEMRSSEAYTAQESARTGHTVLTTIHSNSCESTYSRMRTLCKRKYDMDDEVLMDLVTEAFPIVVFTKQLENKKRRLMEIMECEITPDGKRHFNSLFRYEITENRVEGDKFIINGTHKKVCGISESLKKRFLENGMPREVLNKITGGGASVC